MGGVAAPPLSTHKLLHSAVTLDTQLGSARHPAGSASHSDALTQNRGMNVPSAHTHPPAWAPHTHLPGGTWHWPGNPDVLQHSAFERQLLPTARHRRAYASRPPISRSPLLRAIAARNLMSATYRDSFIMFFF